MKSLTIVIPIRNRASIVLSTLDSVAMQTSRDFKVVLVDNNSTDNSFATVENWIEVSAPQDIKIELIREFNAGASAARNAGARLADTPYICFFDSDDTMRPNYVESILMAFQNNPGTDLVYWKRCIHYGRNKTQICRFSRKRILEFHVWHSLLSTLSWAARTSLFWESGGWNESLLQWDDWELGIRMACLPNLRATGLAYSLVDVYSHGASISGSSFSSRAGGWEKSINAAKEFCASLTNKKLRAHLNRLLYFKEAVLCGNYRKEGNYDAAHKLMSTIRENNNRSPLRRAIYEFAYIYTGLGFRGCASIVGWML